MSRFFENEMEFGMNMSPNDFYRGTQQAFVDEQWENTTAEATVEEQDYIGADTYHKVKVWMGKTIGSTSTFRKDGADFRTLLYQKLDYHPIRGTYFKFEDNWWIADFTNPSEGVMGDVGIRRCTNYLRIIDPENGSIFSVPCVLDYDMTSPSMTVTSSILTPNNHAKIIVQANPDTMRLFTYNKRFVLNGRVFKLTAFQNALYATISEKKPTIFYLDMILDETHDGDDLMNEVANNGNYHYEIIISHNDFEVIEGHKPMPISATVTLNGVEVDREIVWSTSRENVAAVYDDCIMFHHKGTTVITASLKGNPDIKASIKVRVERKDSIAHKITMTGAFEKIRQFETKTVGFVLDNEPVWGILKCSLDGDTHIATIGDNVVSNGIIQMTMLDEQNIEIKCLTYSPAVQNITVWVRSNRDFQTYSQTFAFRAVNMMG